MSILAKMELKTVVRTAKADPIVARRERLIEKLKEQIEVYQALQNGSQYYRTKEKRTTDADGNRVIDTVKHIVKPFFFEQDKGWYVQCRYGSRVINLYNRHNAIFVNNFKDIGNVLTKLIEATSLGEFDKSIAAVMIQRK